MPITLGMNILVCIKQVTTTPRGNTFAMNRFDEYALEAAIQIKEQLTDPGHGAVVDVVTVGRKKAEEVIKRAFGMGADNGFHIVVENDQTAGVTAELIYQMLGQTPNQTLEPTPTQTSGQTPDPSQGPHAQEPRLRPCTHGHDLPGRNGGADRTHPCRTYGHCLCHGCYKDLLWLRNR